MKIDKKEMGLLEGKLRLPIHITYISKYILDKGIDETTRILEECIQSGLIEKSGQEGYYVLKSKV
tara:strand:+ start:16381 stop:16575 length:195 start_codon:yes stop_codon:yes gene_type:complete